jgi:hypothetical protein
MGATAAFDFAMEAVPTPTATGEAAGLAAAPARLGFTVMRAVSFGGAFFITAVPDFFSVGAGGTEVAKAGLSGDWPGVTGITVPGTMGLTCETAPGATGLTGVTATGTGAIGLTAAEATGVTGDAPGGITLTLGVTAEAIAEAAIGMAWVRRGGATEEPWGSEVAAATVGVEELEETRGGGVMPSGFFTATGAIAGGVGTGGGGKVLLSGLFATSGGTTGVGTGGGGVPVSGFFTATGAAAGGVEEEVAGRGTVADFELEGEALNAG